MSKYFATINSQNIVENTILADSKEDAELVSGLTCVEFSLESPAGIHWIYDPATGIFTDPFAPVLDPSMVKAPE